MGWQNFFMQIDALKKKQQQKNTTGYGEAGYDV